MKILIILCEGPHDVAFIYKVSRLALNAQDITGTKLKDFPSPLGSHFVRLLQNYRYEDSQLTGRPEIPTTLSLTPHEDQEIVYLLIYPMGGDSKIESWKDQIQKFQDIAINDLPEMKAEISIGLIFDADDGLADRVKKCHDNFNDILPEITGLNATEQHICLTKSFKSLGLHLFCNDEGTGNLEEILIPLMKLGNEQIFNEALEYLNRNKDNKRPTEKKFKSNYDENKSLLGVVGQLQCSGVANNSIIKQSDYITNDKLSVSEKASELVSFLKSLINSLYE
ncbi:DUF3226 domain-containing protein [Larkinella insperata]|uniref:DUF3226 domain-containing protein n=1 Tax=Larkinella insperata TaxID=332158 RepID=A0ABW3QJK0_9BACT|nr:DUF3226 domain-containing protein [Larkinella insperata]